MGLRDLAIYLDWWAARGLGQRCVSMLGAVLLCRRWAVRGGEGARGWGGVHRRRDGRATGEEVGEHLGFGARSCSTAVSTAVAHGAASKDCCNESGGPEACGCCCPSCRGGTRWRERPASDISWSAAEMLLSRRQLALFAPDADMPA